MSKLSIIIPVYNVEKYLRRCLDSVINQTFKNLEIIIINNASTDDSQNIIDEYKNKDNRIISIINKENIYQGESRNQGLKISTGEYITFVDSDDWLEKEMYEEMIDLILKSKADIVECNFKATNTNDGSMYIRSLIPSFKKNNPAIDKYIMHLNKNELGVVVWNKIYSSKIIKENQIKFEDNKKVFGEDLLFNLEIMHYTHFLITINKPLYNYFIRNESVSHRKDFISLDKITNIIKLFIENTKKFESFKNDFLVFSVLVIPFIKEYVLDQIEKKEMLLLIKTARKNAYILMSLKNCLKYSKSTLKDKLFCLMIILKIHYITTVIFLLFRKNRS